MENKETLAQFLAKLNILYNNLLEFYNKFGEAMNSNAESVTTYQLTDAGNIEEMKIPSIGYYTTTVRALQQQIESLIYANDNEIALQYQDGSVKRFNMQQMSSLVQTLESVSNMSFPVPTDFRTKTNWFFESFLNPLLVVSVNVSTLLAGTDIQKFSVRRVIAMPSDSAQTAYFDESIKGRADLDYYQLLTSLSNGGIQYHIDDNIVDMPTAVNRYRGSFTVVNIVQQDVVDANGTNAQMIYQLDKLEYIDIANGTASSITLAVGDTLVTKDDTEYSVVSVNKSNTTVTLEKKFGIGYINLGTDQLRVRPAAYRVPELQVSVGYNERQVIFISPISAKLDLATDKWSKGFAIYTNELNVTLSDGTTLDMTTYYKNFVSDFGMMFMSYAKERQVPSTIAITPTAPTMAAANFSVININNHLKEDKSVLELKAKISAKEKLENELGEINKVINSLKAKLNEASTINDIEKMKIKKDIDQKVITKNSLLSQLSTTIQEITLSLKSNSTFKSGAKYRVRGFWDIPAPKESEHGTQSVVQFKIMYRYLSKKGNATNVNQLKFTGTTGAEKYGFFSNWNEQVTKLRRKTYDTTKGVFVWADESVQDPDVVNINQVDIPINKGEAVEIRIRSISEAGFPANPAESEWSESVTIPFPDDIEAVEEDSMLADRMFLDAAVVKFQQELNAKGLDIHLLNSLYTGDKYYAHPLSEISSGYYTPEGKIKDSFMVIKELTDRLDALEKSIQNDYGDMRVIITDPLGNATEVKNGSTLNLFAGYYKDNIINSNNVLQHGDVVTKSYVISIENTSATTLELASRVIGGIEERAPFDDDPLNDGAYLPTYPAWIGGDTDYTRNRVYDKVPLVMTSASDSIIGDFKQRSPQQSGQVCGQFIYGRFRDYGLANTLYFDDQLYFPTTGFYSQVAYTGYLNGQTPYDKTYLYVGKQLDPNNLLTYTPSNGYMYFPYMPTANSSLTDIYGAANASVWAGSYDPLSGAPDPNGLISEFCIHVDHPALLENPASPTSFENLCMPAIPDTNSNGQSYSRLAHALHFNITVDEKTDVYGAKYYQQCKYRKPVAYDTVVAPLKQHYNYPIKNGFSVEDEFLIGKYTCGAYLFLGPTTYDDIVVDGNHPKYAKKDVRYKPENALNIPIIFQFRCSDALGYIGGWRKTGDLQNVKYTKKIGLDIYQRDMTKKSIALFGDIFSFDVEVSCQYSKTTNIVTPITVPAGSLTQITYSSTN